MFERFTAGAREVVVLAQDEARGLRHNYLGTEHLLLGLLREQAGVGRRALDRLGVELDDARFDLVRIVGEGRDPAEGDADALRSIGIDLDEVRRRVEETFGPGALERVRAARPGRRARPCAAVPGPAPFGTGPASGHIPLTPRAKKVLQLARREALALHHGFIDTEHILLGVVREGEGVAAEILAARHAPGRRVRSAVIEEISRRGDVPGHPA
jgi:ATP-dependent Clp protease ATP-binding subunit ClpA